MAAEVTASVSGENVSSATATRSQRPARFGDSITATDCAVLPACHNCVLYLYIAVIIYKNWCTLIGQEQSFLLAPRMRRSDLVERMRKFYTESIVNHQKLGKCFVTCSSARVLQLAVIQSAHE